MRQTEKKARQAGKKITVELLNFESYVTAVRNSVGAKLFQHAIATVNGRRRDITKGGELSCALFASSILLLYGLIGRKYANVDSAVRAMRRSGWREIERPRLGAVIVWGERNFKEGEPHKHIGFYMGKGEAVSNSYFKKVPVRHSWKSGKLGAVERILWHGSFDRP